MSIINLTLQRNMFSAETTKLPTGELMLVLQGCADLRVQNEFADLLEALHREARGQNAGLVSVNMERLEFLNSGCFKSMCSWVRLLINRQGTYKIRILSNPQHHWQVRSLHALRMLAPDIVDVEVAERS